MEDSWHCRHMAEKESGSEAAAVPDMRPTTPHVSLGITGGSRATSC